MACCGFMAVKTPTLRRIREIFSETLRMKGRDLRLVPGSASPQTRGERVERPREMVASVFLCSFRPTICFNMERECDGRISFLDVLLDHRGDDVNFSVYRKPCLLYTSPSPRDLSTSRMPSSA